MDFKDKSVLIVDDYRTMLRVMRNILKQIGFEQIDECSDGLAALETVKLKKIDLIISDWNMEKMTGLELLKAVRVLDGNAGKTPFIMVSAENKVDFIIEARNAGVSNYIVKPFSAETLKLKIEAVLK